RIGMDKQFFGCIVHIAVLLDKNFQCLQQVGIMKPVISLKFSNGRMLISLSALVFMKHIHIPENAKAPEMEDVFELLRKVFLHFQNFRCFLVTRFCFINIAIACSVSAFNIEYGNTVGHFRNEEGYKIIKGFVWWL